MYKMEKIEPVGADGVYDATEARARTFVLQLAWLVPCLLVFVFFFQANFRALHMPEAMEAAQLARHISRGEGYTTSLLRPLTLHAERPVTAQPETLHAPLYPLVLAVAFNLFAPTDRTVALVATLCGMLTALLTYLLGRRLLDRTTAGLAAAFVSLNVGFLSAGVEGYYLPLLGLLITLLAYLLVRHAGRVRESAWCGAACGLLYLAEYATLPLLLVAGAVVGLGHPARRRAHVLACLAGFVVIAGPWLVRDWRVSGGPFSTPRACMVASFTDTFPQTSLYRSAPGSAPSSYAYALGHPRQVVKKTLRDLGGLEPKIPAVLEGALLLLLGVAVLAKMEGAARQLRWAMLGGAGLIVLNLAVGEPSFDVLYGFLGAAAVLSAVGLRQVLQARALSPRSTTAILACVLCVAAFQLVLTVALQVPPSTPDRGSLNFLGKELPKDALVVTDEPWTVAWYADRVALWLPKESDPPRGQQVTAEMIDTTRQPEFLAIERLGFRPSAILLTSRLPSYREGEGMTRWQMLRQALGQQIMSNQAPWAPAGWKVTNTFAPAEMLLQRTGVSGRPEG